VKTAEASLARCSKKWKANGRIPERSNEGRRIHVGTKTVSAGSIDVAEDASLFGDNSGAVSCADNHHVERRPGARVKGLITPAAAHRGSSCGPVSSYTQGALV
jgi:hypothetical protein